MHTIGFAGTAKNTGKTTTALHVLELCREAGLRPALTSIGYDGENLDHITGLPKPRYTLGEGDLVATARGVSQLGTALLTPVKETGIQTALGEVIVARVDRPGPVMLAGPNRKSDLLPVLQLFESLGAQAAFLDGALNRCVPLSAADALIYATGAALDKNISHVAEHAAALVEILRIPAARDYRVLNQIPQQITILSRDGVETHMGSGSMLSRQAALAAVECVTRPCSRVFIPGACRPAALSLFIQLTHQHLDGAELILSDPLKLLAGASPLAWKPVLDDARQAGCHISCLDPASLRLLTVNPFYPEYSQRDSTYTPRYIDANALKRAVAAAVPGLPVLDVYQPHEDNILDILGFPNPTPAARKDDP